MRKIALAGLGLLTFALGLAASVFVVGPASALGPISSSSSTATTTSSAAAPTDTDPNSPSAKFFVINGTVNAASDHEILGSSAFPNYANGAVDNYYSLAHSHVDNAPFAEGLASPFDTGPIGQTAAAGNTQQPQYADSRWPGDADKKTYGTPGQPYAEANAGEYDANAQASLASSALTSPSGPSEPPVPVPAKGRLHEALATWKAKWEARLHSGSIGGKVSPPAPTVSTPVVTVKAPGVTVTTPTVNLPNAPAPPAPPVTVPSVGAPSAGAPKSEGPSRSMTSATPQDGAAHLESETQATVDPKATALVTKGESRLSRVSLAGGQIVLKGIHVFASITNDGTNPTYKTSVNVASATIGGVPVTIDEDGVHVAGQGGALPYQQASDALNSALNRAGISIFMVGPEVKKGGPDNGNDQKGQNGAPFGPPTPMTTTSTTDTTTTSTTDTSTTSTTDTTSSSTCSSTSTTDTSTTTTSTNDKKGSTTTNASPLAPPGGTTTTTSTTSTNGGGDTGLFGDATDANELTVRASGVHVVFKQPVDQPGVPSQVVEHILGEVYVDSLAVPAGAFGATGDSSCGTGKGSGKKGATSGSSSSGSSGSSGGSSSSLGSSSGSQLGSGVSSGVSGSNSGSLGNSLPAAFAEAIRKPLWLLVAYLIWQALVVATGWSLWNWRREEAP